MGPRGVENPLHSSLPPPRPPDPSQFKLNLQAHKEEVAARFSKFGQSITTFAAEQEEFQRELREELRQLRLSYGEPSLPQPHSNTPTTMVSAPPLSSSAGTPFLPNYCQLPEPPPIPNCKPQPQISDPTPPASFTLTQAVANPTDTHIINAITPPQNLRQIHHSPNVKPHKMKLKFGLVHQKVRIQSLITWKRTLSNLPRIGTLGRSSKSGKEASSSSWKSRLIRKLDDSKFDSCTGSSDSDSSNLSPVRSKKKRSSRKVSGASLDVFLVKAQKQSQASGDSKTTWVNHRVRYHRCKSQKQILGRYYHRDYGPVEFLSGICVSKKCGSVSSIILCFAWVYELSRGGRKLNLKHKCSNQDYNEAVETMLREKIDKAFRENGESMSLWVAQFDRKGFDFLLELLLRGFKWTDYNFFRLPLQGLFNEGLHQSVLVPTGDMNSLDLFIKLFVMVLISGTLVGEICDTKLNVEFFGNNMKSDGQCFGEPFSSLQFCESPVNLNVLKAQFRSSNKRDLTCAMCLENWIERTVGNALKLSVRQATKGSGKSEVLILTKGSGKSEVLILDQETNFLQRVSYLKKATGLLKNNFGIPFASISLCYGDYDHKQLNFGFILGLFVYSSRVQPEHEHVIASNMIEFYNPNCGVKWVRVVHIYNQPSNSSIVVIGFLIAVLELSHGSILLWIISASVKPDLKLFFMVAKNFKPIGNLLSNALYDALGITLITAISFNKARKIILLMSNAVHEPCKTTYVQVLIEVSKTLQLVEDDITKLDGLFDNEPMYFLHGKSAPTPLRNFLQVSLAHSKQVEVFSLQGLHKKSICQQRCSYLAESKINQDAVICANILGMRYWFSWKLLRYANTTILANNMMVGPQYDLINGSFSWVAVHKLKEVIRNAEQWIEESCMDYQGGQTVIKFSLPSLSETHTLKFTPVKLKLMELIYVLEIASDNEEQGTRYTKSCSGIDQSMKLGFHFEKWDQSYAITLFGSLCVLGSKATAAIVACGVIALAKQEESTWECLLLLVYISLEKHEDMLCFKGCELLGSYFHGTYIGPLTVMQPIYISWPNHLTRPILL